MSVATASSQPGEIETARKEVEAALVQKALEDADFRGRLVRDPQSVLKELLGFNPIPNYTIRVIEEQPGEVVLVLPRPLEIDELPDELLDLAAGGTTTALIATLYSGTILLGARVASVAKKCER
ncbi:MULTISPECIES: NHLP leader peptide family RiPP precursor [unclassified Pannonibacter]|uniref:NHLP leader peptide family RiPP precursor n=1 Tax=unclassified Pannonibacter TaxID=2627228 RepID=UPI001645F990|nr:MULTISPECIES: NHLP leader peptide family RiPP precursor [unclassified Pannonibacter]